MIKFSQVTKKYGSRVVLDELSFEIQPKEFVFLTGPSGAGKTTLIKLILRQLLPDQGTIVVAEEELASLKRRFLPRFRQKVGTVFQDLKLLADRTVRENVSLALRIAGKPEKEVFREVEEALELVGLENVADFFPSQLAGGELQRVAIARAVVARPEIVIADEPTGNLDPATAWRIVKLLKEINQMGKTVVVATHNFEIVNSLKDRVLALDQGKLVSDKDKGKYQVK